jgi:hypothetical protein
MIHQVLAVRDGDHGRSGMAATRRGWYRMAPQMLDLSSTGTASTGTASTAAAAPAAAPAATHAEVTGSPANA